MCEFAEQIITIENGKLVSEKTTDEAKEKAAVESHEMTLQKAEKEPKFHLWKRAFKNFRVHLLRYIAIAFSVAFGVLCFMFSLSSENIMKQSVSDFENKNTAYHNGYIKFEEDEKELLEILKKDERIENIYLQYILHDVTLKIGEQEERIAEKYPMAKATEQMSYGVMPRSGKKEIAISPSLAAKFEKNIQNLIGKSAEVTYADKKYVFTVSGIFNAAYDDFFISSDVEQKLYEGLSTTPYSISYDVKEFEDIVAVSDSLEEQNINSQNASLEVAAFLETFRNLKRLFMVISILVFVIGLFISVILLFKQQNTRMHEVGLLSALGYGKGHIQKILLYENLMLAVMAVFVNLLLMIAALGISKAFGFLFVYTLSQILTALGLTVIFVMIIGFLASLRLIRVEPAVALRS